MQCSQRIARMWDPGRRVQDHEERNKLFKINVLEYIYHSLLSTMMVSAIDVSEEANDMEEESRTELESESVDTEAFDKYISARVMLP